MADLFWFPFFAKDWLSSPARMSMSPAQRGAYIDLLACAWGNGSEEPCLEANPVTLAGLSGLGRDWKRLSPLVLAQFDERDGLLYNAKLSDVWHEAQGKHQTAVLNGQRGAAKRLANRKGRSSHPQATLAHSSEHTQSQSEGELKTPTEFLASPPPDALGAEAPRLAEHRVMGESGISSKPTTIADVLQSLNPRRFAMRHKPV